tara:strand:+ start:654 stop:1022 length:369 start_codon:yes stop_codon:yes gene_type:complete
MRNIILTNSLFDNLLTNWDNAFFDGNLHWRKRDSSIDCREDEDSYEYYIPLAGFKKEDIAARIDEGRVYVAANKGEDTAASCSFALPDEAEPSSLSAKHEDGLLTITIPKLEKAKAITIAID